MTNGMPALLQQDNTPGAPFATHPVPACNPDLERPRMRVRVSWALCGTHGQSTHSLRNRAATHSNHPPARKRRYQIGAEMDRGKLAGSGAGEVLLLTCTVAALMSNRMWQSVESQASNVSVSSLKGMATESGQYQRLLAVHCQIGQASGLTFGAIVCTREWDYMRRVGGGHVGGRV